MHHNRLMLQSHVELAGILDIARKNLKVRNRIGHEQLLNFTAEG
jgi:hypothetical protein